MKATVASVKLDILMGVVSGCHGDNFPVCMSTLHNIARLAKHSHVWREDHLKKLHQLKSRVSSNPKTYQQYLDVLVGLTKRARPGLIMGLYETLSELGNLGQSECMEMRIRFLQMSCNILCRLYRTLGRFLCCSEVAPEQVLSLLDSILKIPISHANITQLIEFCCQIASRLPFVVPKLHHWARSVVVKESRLSSTALAYLLLAPSIHLPDDIDALMKGTDLDRYVIARVAFRNGHWRRAALPNLEAICTDRLSLENCEWIQALQSLAASQLSEFSVAALFEQNKHLYRVHSILKSLAQSSQHDAALSFPSDWVACLLYSSDAALQIASAISPTLNWCKHPLSTAVVFRVKK
ncbi:hypothetical protein OSTOST_22032, partial [Ostertagia ostertagi]